MKGNLTTLLHTRWNDLSAIENSPASSPLGKRKSTLLHSSDLLSAVGEEKMEVKIDQLQNVFMAKINDLKIDITEELKH